MATDTDKIIEILLILFLPPLAVWFHSKECNGHVCLNIVLLLLVIPAYVHALWYCFMRDAWAHNNSSGLYRQSITLAKTRLANSIDTASKRKYIVADGLSNNDRLAAFKELDKYCKEDISKIGNALENVDKWIKFIYELQESQIVKEQEHYDKFAIGTTEEQGYLTMMDVAVDALRILREKSKELEAEIVNLEKIINPDDRPDVKAVLRNEEPYLRFNIPTSQTPNVHLAEALEEALVDFQKNLVLLFFDSLDLLIH
uniref:Uncharacterized protein n=1 Tax=Acrobeloides nanus TaxID=290746 RepID=A0A914EIZ5_9BILA